MKHTVPNTENNRLYARKLEKEWDNDNYKEVDRILSEHGIDPRPADLRAKAVEKVESNEFDELSELQDVFGKTYLFEEEVEGMVCRYIENDMPEKAKGLVTAVGMTGNDLGNSFKETVEEKAEEYFEENYFEELDQLMDLTAGKIPVEESKVQEKYKKLFSGGMLHKAFNMSLAVPYSPKKETVEKQYQRFAENGDVDKMELLNYISGVEVPKGAEELLAESDQQNVEYLADYRKYR